MADNDRLQDELSEHLPRFISAHEVAVEAGVSRSAVSRTFTPGASVSPSTREKVLKAAENWVIRSMILRVVCWPSAAVLLV